MKYLHSFDIWSVPSELLRHVQPGQHVYAGTPDNKGVFLGVKTSGTIVVAWHGNMIGRNRGDYIQSLRSYAKGR